ncbi:TetR/AcrR family transcriptional regulator [Marinomonas sp.]
MKTSKKHYHHGDLNQSLLNAASLILRNEGVEGLSMRKLADQVGVSRTAPYHHFKDKNALLCSLAEAGFKQQQADLQALADNSGATREAFTQYVYRYLAYAQNHSEIYDLMFGRTIWKAGEPTAELQNSAKSTFKTWVYWIGLWQESGVLTQNNTSLRIGQTTWASLHGLARLMIDGVYPDQTGQSEMVEQMIRNLCSHQ